MVFNVGASMNVNLAQHFNPFYAAGLFFTPRKHQKTCVFLILSGGIESDRRHDVD